MSNNNLDLLSKDDFLSLSEKHDDYCATIYIPTHRSGQEVNQGVDSLLFKNQLQDLEKKLENQGMNPREIKSFLAPALDLLEDPNFWQNQSDGLAVFIGDDFFAHYELPVRFEKYLYLGNNFYLKPLTPLFVGDGPFYLLLLGLENVRLYECTRHTITNLEISDLVPDGIEESIGSDVEQTSLQFRTQQQGQGHANFHGHGEGKDDHKIEVEKYLRDVNNGLQSFLHDKSAPLILFCNEYMYAIYKQVNTYGNLFDSFIKGSPVREDVVHIHEQAWELIRPVYAKEKEEKINQCVALHDTDRTSAEVEHIIPAVFAGKVDTLFIQNRTDIWGIYKQASNEVEVHGREKFENVSLLDLAAKETIKHGGTVYLLEKEEMPFDFSRINALYRYK